LIFTPAAASNLRHRIRGCKCTPAYQIRVALRLRWLWFEWVEPDRPWVGTEVPCTEIDRQLFRASTSVTVGNGLRASFWDSPWLDGMAPRDIAPHLHKLAWRKRNTVAEDLHNMNWTRGLWRLSTEEEFGEFFWLSDRLQGFQLTDEPDSHLALDKDWVLHVQVSLQGPVPRLLLL
jgi:hypothetical protein